MAKKNWSIPTSPRSPYKIRDELMLLAKYEGQNWDEDLQAVYGKALSESEFFQGKVPETPDWVGRARFGTIKFWGFAYKREDGSLAITEAGRDLMRGKREDEIFTKQFVKWQYPDNQHNGNEYPPDQFSLHPFIATLRILYRTKYLTKDEIALFLFTMLKDEQATKVAEDILRFRNALGRIKGRTPRRQFVMDILRKRDLERLKAKNAQKLSEFLYRTMGTFHDYADALIRYFRYTQLVSLTGTYEPAICIAGPAREKAKLVSQMKPKVVRFDETDKFYSEYYGNPAALLLPYENASDLARIVGTLIQTNIDLVSKLKASKPVALLPQVSLPTVLPTDVEALKDLESQQREQARMLQRYLIGIDLKTSKKVLEIIQEFDAIAKGHVIDPPTYLEWNTWRAFESLDVAEKVVPNLTFSDDMQPLSPAGGNKPDLEVHYDDYVLVLEVTLKSGAVQWRDEAEPVPVHVINIGRSNPSKPTYGLFIAPKIDTRTSNVFYGIRKTPDLFGDKVNVIPLSINQFKDVLSFLATTGFSPTVLRNLLDMIDDSRGGFDSLQSDRGIAWVESIGTTIAQWKKNYNSS